jgi:hypothetical protein
VVERQAARVKGGTTRVRGQAASGEGQDLQEAVVEDATYKSSFLVVALQRAFVETVGGRCESYNGHAMMLEDPICCVLMPYKGRVSKLQASITGDAKDESQSCKPLTSELQRATCGAGSPHR